MFDLSVYNRSVSVTFVAKRPNDSRGLPVVRKLSSSSGEETTLFQKIVPSVGRDRNELSLARRRASLNKQSIQIVQAKRDPGAIRGLSSW